MDVVSKPTQPNEKRKTSLQASPSLHNLLHPPKSPSQSQTPATKKKKKKENMTILKSFPLPSSPSSLQIPNEKEKDSPPSNFFFIAFLASKDPLTNQPWCPDVRAALPILEATFQEPTTSQGAEGEEGKEEKEEGKKSTTPPPVVAFIEVGQKTEYVFSFFFLFFLLFSSSFSHIFVFFLGETKQMEKSPQHFPCPMEYSQCTGFGAI